MEYTFDEAYTVVKDVLKKTGTHIGSIEEYDGIVVKKLAETNTLDESSSKQTHIAITGAQMDFFPYFKISGYLNPLVVSEADKNGIQSLKQFYVLQIPVILNESNCTYLNNGNNTKIIFVDGIAKSYTSIVRSTRRDKSGSNSEQIQISLLDNDEKSFIEFRHLLHTFYYLIILKRCGKFEYEFFGVNNTDPKIVSELDKFNNKFYHVNHVATFINSRTLINDKRDTILQSINGENIIYYGVPGCGKSYFVKHNVLTGINEGQIFRTVFHPDYTYQDFVGQIMPALKAEDDAQEQSTLAKKIVYEFIPGPFTEALKKAIENKHNGNNEPVYLVIDELTRGNASAIFGDIFQLLDREIDGTSTYKIHNRDIAREVYKNIAIKDEDKGNSNIYLPDNLFLIATMNTSDQNVFPLDNAFKRRWKFKMIPNEFDTTEGSYEKILGDTPISGTGIAWKAFVETINSKLIVKNIASLGGMEDKRIGKCFVRKEELEDRKLFAEKVLMYLWSDIFKYERDNIFNQEFGTLEGLITAFSKDEISLNKIFNQEHYEDIFGKGTKLTGADQENADKGTEEDEPKSNK